MRRKSKRKLLTLDVIRAASKGDYEAMDIVLRHYEGYILKLSIRHMSFGKSCCRLHRRYKALLFQVHHCFHESAD